VAPLGAAGVLQAGLLLFFVNVVLLPGYKMQHPVSLLLSAVALAALGLAVWGTRILASRNPHLLSLFGGGLVVVGPVVVALSWPREPTPRTPTGSGPNVVVVVMDAVRRDYVGLHGSKLGATPDLDVALGRGRIFDAAYAGSGSTRPSVPFLLGHARGSHPNRWLPEALHRRGYVSACFSDNPILERGSSISLGFQFVGVSVTPMLRFGQRVFEGTFLGEHVLRWSILAHLWDDRRLVADALDWARRVRGPFFLYVHLMDAHQPYDHGALGGRSRIPWRLMTPVTGTRFSREEQDQIRDGYAGAVNAAQAAAAQLVAGVAALERPYIAVVTADHGESLGEGGRWGHAGLSRELVSVPLAVLGEGVAPGRVSRPVGHASILKTVLAAAGAPCQGCRGTDLRTSEGDDDVVGEYPPGEFFRVREGHRLVGNGSRVALYDIVADPLETRDVGPDRPEIVDRLLTGLIPSQGGAPTERDEVERLRALGYVQ
jgi:hypothetical protein